MTTQLMWEALDLQFAVLRFPPFPFTFNRKKKTLHYSSAWTCGLLFWHVFMRSTFPGVAFVSCSILLREILSATPHLSIVRILFLIIFILFSLLVFNLTVEYTTKGKGLIDAFNQFVRIEQSLLSNYL